MVVQILEALQVVFLQQENITENIIFLEEMEKSEFDSAPWISILPETANIEPAWQNTIDIISMNEKSYKVQQKYKIDQPIMIRMVFEDKKELDQVTDQFLVELPKSLIVDKVRVEITPQEIDRIFAKGMLDVSVAIIKLSAEYPVLKYIEQNKISTIDFDLK